MERVDRASRRIAAPAQTVYDAVVDRRALESWLPPEGMTGRIEQWDPGPGGGFRMVLTYLDPTDAPGKSSAGTDRVSVGFGTLDPPTCVTHLATFDSDDPAYSGTMTMTWNFAADGRGTEVTVTATGVPTGIDQAAHQAGMASSLENLANYLEG